MVSVVVVVEVDVVVEVEVVVEVVVSVREVVVVVVVVDSQKHMTLRIPNQSRFIQGIKSLNAVINRWVL